MGTGDPDPLRPIHTYTHTTRKVAIGYLRNTGTDLLERGPIASRGRSVRPSVKYVDD